MEAIFDYLRVLLQVKRHRTLMNRTNQLAAASKVLTQIKFCFISALTRLQPTIVNTTTTTLFVSSRLFLSRILSRFFLQPGFGRTKEAICWLIIATKNDDFATLSSRSNHRRSKTAQKLFPIYLDEHDFFIWEVSLLEPFVKLRI